MTHSKGNVCKICGFKYQNFYPWGENGDVASFEICDCCGVTFGYEDSTQISILRYRREWIVNGAKWWNVNQKPADWTLEDAMLNIPKEYL